MANYANIILAKQSNVANNKPKNYANIVINKNNLDREMSELQSRASNISTYDDAKALLNKSNALKTSLSNLKPYYNSDTANNYGSFLSYVSDSLSKTISDEDNRIAQAQAYQAQQESNGVMSLEDKLNLDSANKKIYGLQNNTADAQPTSLAEALEKNKANMAKYNLNQGKSLNQMVNSNVPVLTDNESNAVAKRNSLNSNGFTHFENSDSYNKLINSDEYKKAVELGKSNKSSALIESGKAGLGSANYMTDNEKNYYNYLLGSKGQEAATNFFNNLGLNTRKSEADATKIANTGGLSEGLQRAGVGVKAGLANYAERETQSSAFEGSDASKAFLAQTQKNRLAIQQENDRLSSTGGIGAGVSQLATTLGEALPQIVMSIGYNVAAPGATALTRAIGSTMIGRNLGNSVGYQALQQGYSKQQSAQIALADGALQGGLEYLLSAAAGGTARTPIARTISNIFTEATSDVITNSTVKALLKTATGTVGDMLSNGVEEWIQQWGEPLIRNVILDEHNEVNPLSQDSLYAGFMGMLAGGLFGIQSLPSEFKEAKNASKVSAIGSVYVGNEEAQKGLFELANKVGDEELNKFVSNLQQKISNGEDVTAYDFGSILCGTVNKSYIKSVENTNDSDVKLTAQNIADYLANQGKEEQSNLQSENNPQLNAESVNQNNINQTTENISSVSPFVEPNPKSTNNDDIYTKIIKSMRETTETQTEQQKYVSGVAKTLNRKVLFDIESDTVAGTIDKDGTIHINKDTSKFNQPVMTVFKHELTHDLENSKQYDNFENAVENSAAFKDWLVSKGAVGESTKDMIANYRNTVQDRYSKSGVSLGTNDAAHEVISEFVGDNLFTNQNSINELARANRNIFDVIVNWIRDMKKRFIGTEQEKSFAKLEQMYKKAFDSAIKQNESVENSIPEQKYSVPATKEVSSLADKFKNGEISKDDFMQEIDERYNEAIKNYGTIEKGESPKVDIDVPTSIDSKAKISRFTRTVMESGHLNDDMLEDVKSEIIKGAQSYKPISNEKAQSYAERVVKSGSGDAIWKKIVNGDSHVTKQGIAVGEALLKMEADAGHTARTMELIAELSEVGTRSGQAVQAMSMLKRMTGVGQLYYVQRAIDTLNTDLAKKYKSKAPIVKIRNSLAEQLVRARTSEDIDTAVGELMQDVGEQVPASKLDKWNSWRYLAMLGNPKTHIRNLLGNSVFMPAVKAKNIIATGLEKTFISQENRTKSFNVKKEFKDFAKNDFNNVADIITGNGKMNPSDQIRDNQKIFKNKVLEYFRAKNFDLLEKEDMLFLKHHYEIALGGYLQAKGLDVNNIEDFQLDNAREYAIKEAWKATYRDTNAFASSIQKISNSNKVANVIVEGILPFKKTPINILKRGIEYSPVGLLKTLSKGVYDLNQGNISSTEFIDGLASGLTGVGITAIGALLANLGVINGGFGDDDEDYYKKLNGEQPYSIQLYGTSYTIDWLAPASLPFFIGVEAMNMQNRGEDISPFTTVMNAMTVSLEPMTELSMLSGINDTIEAAKYSDSPLTTIVSNSLSSYALQALPTLGGQISRTIDGTRRQTYIDKNSGVPELIQTFVQSAMNKIPGASFAKQEYVDAQGQKDDTKNIILRAIGNMISPGYASTVEYDSVNTELQSLYKKTGETSLLPKSAPKNFTVDGNKVNLTAKQYTEYATYKGDYAKKLIQQMMANEKYEKLEEAAKVTAIKNLYEYANAKAKEKVSTYDATDNYAKYEQAEKSGNIANYVIQSSQKTQATKAKNIEKKANN